MSRTRSHLEQQSLQSVQAESAEPVTRFDTAVEWLLGALLVFMPFALGVVAPWSETAVALVAAVIAVLLLLKRLVHREVNPVWSWAYLPVVLFVLLVVLQLTPLAASLAGAISPNTLGTRQQLLADLPDSPDLLRAFTLSFYPPATRHDLGVVLFATVIFAAVVDVYRRPSQVKRLLTVIAAVGGVVALLAVLQNISGTDKIYWSIPTWGRATSGPFVNHSNFAQFINLSIGAALGLLLVTLRESSGGSAPDSGAGSRSLDRLKSPAMRPVWWLGAVVVLSMVALFLSMSRGGMVSALIALGITTLLLARRQRLSAQGWVVTSLALAAFIGVLYTGFDAVVDRFGKLATSEDPSGGRFQVYKDIAVAWQKFPAVGTGLGSHEVVYPMFDRSTYRGFAEHADSDWFQVAEETGAVGLVLVLAFVGLIAFNYVRVIGARRPRVCAAGFGLGYGLIAVICHSMTDFGQHLPAVAALSAVSCGLLVGLARMARRARAARLPAEDVTVEPPQWRWSPIRLALPAGLAVAALWTCATFADTWRAETHSERARLWAESLEDQDWQGTDDDYTELLAAADSAVALQPDNVRYRYRLNWYRWRSISRETDPETGAVVLGEDGLQHAARIVDELHDARRYCPTFGPLYSFAGQIETSFLNDPDGPRHVRTGYALAPAHPETCFAAALVDASEGKWDESVAGFRRCLALHPPMLPDVLDVYVYRAGRPDLAIAVTKDNVSWLLRTARVLKQADLGPDRDRTMQALSDAIARLKSQGPPPDATAHELAAMAGLCREQKDHQGEADYYRWALALDYGQVDWRFRRARALGELGKYEDAMHEARICLRLRPQMEAARKLILDLRGRDNGPVARE